MYSVTKLDLATLDPHLHEAYAALTDPKYQCCLNSQNPYELSNTTQLAIGATWEEKPIGLVLASEMNFLHFAELYSIYVIEPHRHCKIATQMLSLLESELVKLGSNYITFVYPTEDPTTPYLENLLQNLGWSSPRLFSIHCRFDEKMLTSPWLNKDLQLSSAFSIFPWKELTAEERRFLIHQQEQGAFSPSVSPFGKEEAILENINSLGLRYNNKVVGWMITHRVAPDTIRYSALYIQREFQYRKEAIILLSKAIKLQKEAGVPWGIMDINIAQIEPSYLQFVQKRYIPFAHTVTYTRHSFHQLRDVNFESV